jgi:CPA2 family monovalent cation:H+ antiporter-2
LGLSQVGEFAFILFLISEKLGILPYELGQIGICTTLLSLLISPFLFKAVIPFWKTMRELTKETGLKHLFIQRLSNNEEDKVIAQNHVIIAGYGRMGKWIGKALKEIGVSFIVIDYNHKVVKEAKAAGIVAFYGDASFPEILIEANVRDARAVLVTVPDITAQEEIIVFVQKNFPAVKIMARAHLDSDIKKLVKFKLAKVVQPEFEAALAIVKSILTSSGKSKEEVSKKIKSLRLSHANI